MGFCLYVKFLDFFCCKQLLSFDLINFQNFKRILSEKELEYSIEKILQCILSGFYRYRIVFAYVSVVGSVVELKTEHLSAVRNLVTGNKNAAFARFSPNIFATC